MRILLDSAVCKKYGFTIEEALVFILISQHKNIETIQASLIRKGYIIDNIFSDHPLIASGMTNKFNEMLRKCDGFEEDDFDYVECVTKMREFYPKGSKKINNNSYPWKGNIKDCVAALKWLRYRYRDVNTGEMYTMEQITNATKRYVDSFHGDYEESQMRIMRNFIRLRYSEPDESGIPRQKFQSDLATWIENEDDPDFKPTYSGTLLN